MELMGWIGCGLGFALVGLASITSVDVQIAEAHL